MITEMYPDKQINKKKLNEFRYSNKPSGCIEITIAANIPYKDKHIALNNGFRWNPKWKFWFREIRSSKFESFKKSLPFDVFFPKSW